MTRSLPVWMALVAAWPARAQDPVLEALDTEMARTMAAYAGRDDAPYYLAYRVVDDTDVTVTARYGALGDSDTYRTRMLDVAARVGSPALDSTHPIRDVLSWNLSWYEGAQMPVDGDVAALRTVVWQSTDAQIRDANQKFVQVQANRDVKVEETDPSPDFSVEAPVVDVRDTPDVAFDPKPWEAVLVELSDRLDDHPKVHASSATLSANFQVRWVVDSEGTRIREPRTWLRVALWGSTVADDGMDLDLYRWKDVHDPADLPAAADLQAWADELVRDLIALREAPVGEPYSGPMILRGRAAGVFVHEVLGHRVEGHRQKDEEEGQTFREQVGRRILPETIDVFDDPSLATYAGERLNGHYAYDEEGRPGARAVLVEDGVFQGFLMSRSPIEGFSASNGHGRAMAGMQPVARMANTVVATSDPVPFEEMRKRLIDEVKASGRPYGLIVDEIGGGFTMTGRFFPNAFNVRAGTAWRVYPDGRPDELVRGIDLVGTPLVALGRVIAAGDDPAVFNGFCGAESGYVPNSAISPSLLLGELEVQRKEKAQDRPPLLPKPTDQGGDS